MFGKKKKAETEVKQETVVQPQASQQTQPSADSQEKPEEKIFVESEIINDEDENALPKEYESIAYILKQELGEDLVAQPVDDDVIEDVPLEEVSEEPAPETETAETEVVEPKSAETETTETETAQETEDAQSESETDDAAQDEEQVVEDEQNAEEKSDEDDVVYVVDGPSEDDDELVKPAKLVKLPNLVDYMLSQNMSKQMKMNIATLLLSTYNKYKDVPAEKKIVIQCMAKVMRSLMQG